MWKERHARVGLVLLAVLVLLLWLASDMVLIVFAGILIAVGLTALSQRLAELTSWPYRVSLGVIIVTGFVFAGSMFWWHGGQVAEEFQRLGERLPAAAETFVENLRQHDWGRMLIQTIPEIGQANGGNGWPLVGAFSKMVSSTFGAFGALVVMLAIGIYGALEARLYFDGAVLIAPPSKRDRVKEVLLAVKHALGWWLVGRLVSMAIVGALTAIGLWVLGMPLALSLGLIAGLLSFVPNIGPVASLIPALLMASGEGGQMMLYVGLLYIGVQTIESYFITPFIDKKAVRLPPALLIAMQILFGSLFGLLGLIYATPIAVSIIIVVQMLYSQDVLGDEVVLMGEHPEDESSEAPQT